MTHKSWTRRESLIAGGNTALAAGLWSSGLTPAAAQAGANPLDVKVVCTDGSAEYIIEEVMLRQKYFQQAGLRAQVSYVLGVPNLIKSVLANSVDICIASGVSPVLAAIAKGSPLRIVAGSNLLPVQCLFSKNPEIKSAKDLIGRKVGTGPKGALVHQLIFALLDKEGLDPSKVDFVNLGNSDTIFKAVVSGKVDAGPGEIQVYEQQNKYGVHALTDGALWIQLPNYTNQGSYASLDAIQHKRERLVRVLAAYLRAYRFLDGPDSKDVFTAARAAAFKNADPAETETQWKFYQEHKPFSMDLTLSEERLNYIQKLNVKMGLQDHVLPFDQVADMSLAKEAAARLA